MYEGLIKTLQSCLFGNIEKENSNGKDNTLTDGSTKLVSKGNITFDGNYMNAQILEKKKALLSDF